MLDVLILLLGLLAALAIVGLVLLIVGLVRKRKGLWVAGIIVAALSVSLMLPTLIAARRLMADEADQLWNQIKQEASETVEP